MSAHKLSPAGECRGKEQLTRRQATAVARRMGTAEAYRCEPCNAWHVASTRDRGAKRTLRLVRGRL